jgi:2-polyprenyl-3-methyl-5-hydroxy-6-metoxy-1,4-benzoquinol methylase
MGNLLPCDGYPPIKLYERLSSDGVYKSMERFSDEFLRDNADALRNYSELWVKDPLRTWSRSWEYLYVYCRLCDILQDRPATRVQLLDLGSGLTFFPHWIASQHSGVTIRCIDNDPQLIRDSKKLVSPAIRSAEYEEQDLGTLNLPDSAFDVVYCISVIEHCLEIADIFANLKRIIKPGGHLLLTIDVSPDGASDVPFDKAATLLQHLMRNFASSVDYAALLGAYDESKMLNTRWVRQRLPELLPWQKRGLLTRLWRHIRYNESMGGPFSLLTCFCMSWRSR